MSYKIRTITVGVTLARGGRDSGWSKELSEAVLFLGAAKSRLEGLGCEVQTIRVATNSFEEYCETSSEAALLADVSALVSIVQGLNRSILLNIGPAHSLAMISAIPKLLRAFPVTCSAAVGMSPDSPIVPDTTTCKAVADAITEIAKTTPGGEGNFNFAATFNCNPGVPFFPAGYHSGPRSFGIGLENAGLLVEAFQSVSTSPDPIADAPNALTTVLTRVLTPINDLCVGMAAEFGIQYDGIDTSIAPSPDAPSIVTAYEALGLGVFGGSGCLAISSLVTSVLKSIPVQKCGYCGIMLPPLEDKGLMERAGEGTYTIKDLLQYSAVCGIGLDTVPIPGDASPAKIAALLMDVCSLAFKLNKPLSCRLFPVPGKRAGDVTEFTNPHLCNGVVFGL